MKIDVSTGMCAWCGQPSSVSMTLDQQLRYDTWKELRRKAPWKAPHVQRAFPDLTAGEREQLINGTHSACFDEMFPEEEE